MGQVLPNNHRGHHNLRPRSQEACVDLDLLTTGVTRPRV